MGETSSGAALTPEAGTDLGVLETPPQDLDRYKPLLDLIFT